MFLSVVIPAYNESELLGSTISKLRSSIPQGVEYELIVCDNNSTDQTSEVAKKNGALVIFEEHNQIGRARNAGASIASGEWLLFVDADTYPSIKLMEEVVSEMENGGIIGCGATVSIQGGTIINKLRMERLNGLFRILKLCGGAFLLCEKEAFDKINGFSSNLYAYEEIDFISRLKKYGRQKNKSFKVLHRNPVITSGRKSEYNLISLFRLVFSNFFAVIFFILHYILPGRLHKKISHRFLGYWYSR